MATITPTNLSFLSRNQTKGSKSNYLPKNMISSSSSSLYGGTHLRSHNKFSLGMALTCVSPYPMFMNTRACITPSSDQDASHAHHHGDSGSSFELVDTQQVEVYSPREVLAQRDFLVELQARRKTEMDVLKARMDQIEKQMSLYQDKQQRMDMLPVDFPSAVDKMVSAIVKRLVGAVVTKWTNFDKEWNWNLLPTNPAHGGHADKMEQSNNRM